MPDAFGPKLDGSFKEGCRQCMCPAAQCAHLCVQLCVQASLTAPLCGSPVCSGIPISDACLPACLPALQASLTGLPPLPPPKGRSTFVIKTAGWFITTLLLGILAVGGLVLLAFGPPPAGAAPAARTGAALAMLPAVGNASQRLVVYSGLGQASYLFKDVHTYE